MVDWQASHVGLDCPPSSNAFYIDTRGCSSNAVYEKNMGLDVPTYALWNGRLPDHSLRAYWRKKSLQMRRIEGRGLKTKLVAGLKRGALDLLDPSAMEEDGPRMHIALRYWGARNAMRLRDPNAARIRPTASCEPKRRRRRFDDRGQISTPLNVVPPSQLFIPLPKDGPVPQPQPVTMEESITDLLRRRTAEYNARLHKRPKDEALWMEFVQFQEETAVDIGGKKASRQMAEKKLAILERATAVNPQSVPLWSQQLAVAREVLEPEALEDMWDRTLRHVPHSAELWKQFIAWRRSAFSLYSASEVRYLYAKASQRLLAHRHQLIRDREELAAQEAAGEDDADMEGSKLEAKVAETEERLLQLFHEVVEYERFSGHHERALGLLQALVEYNCFVDDGLVDTDDHLRRFRQFWEAEVPRVGEVGAVGWCNTDLTAALGQPRPAPPWWMGYGAERNGGEDGPAVLVITKAVPQPEHSGSDSDSSDSGDGAARQQSTVPKSQLLRWVVEEELRDRCHWLPCRPVHEPQLYTADPERVVLWDDVESHLFYLYSPRLRLHLIFLLLEFMGVPVIFNQRCIHDELVHQTLISKALADDAEQTFVSLLLEPSMERVFEWQPTTWTPGHRDCWDDARKEFVRNVFALALRAFVGEKTLPMARMEWEARLSLEGALEVGKALLQQHREDLVLWLQYACLLRRAGQGSRALTVFTAIIHDALPRASAEEQQAIGPWIYRNFAEAVLIPNDAGSSTPPSSTTVANAICVLSACMDHQKVQLNTGGSSAAIRALKALKQYETALSPLLNARPGDELPRLYMLLETLLCHSLLVFLTRGWEEGLQLFQRVVESNAIPKGTTEHQYLWLLCLRFAHMPLWLRRPLVPRHLLRITGMAATLFPCHPVFVSLHLRAEVKLGLVYRCRSFLAKACNAGRCPLVFIYSALAELHLLPQSPGTRTKVRNVLERGLAVVQGSGQVALWLLYLRFEASHGTLDSFKGVFFRAVDACCSVKGLWLTPFRLKSDDMTAEELQEVLHLMLEKDLHLRTFLEEAE